MMPNLFDQLGPVDEGSGAALTSGIHSISREDLLHRAESLAFTLIKLEAQRVALYMDNGIDWIVSDLACQMTNKLVVPLPLFFSKEQIRHTLASAGVDTIISDSDIGTIIPEAEPARAGTPAPPVVSGIYRLRPGPVSSLPLGTNKITYTSGTTGTPKGVCLSTAQQLTLAQSLASLIDIPRPRHLCVLPLSTLLENLAGVYTPLIAGGTVVVPPLSEVGISGSSGLDIQALLRSISHHQPDSLILVPELLNALVIATHAGWRPPDSLRFVAVGGGKVSPDRLLEARRMGIPAFEGYGLSENASVVSLNVPGAERVGSVGQPLPHVRVRVEKDEIVVSGSTFLGYVDDPDSWGAEILRTGDTGHVDADGYLYVDGRIKNQLISSFGRNISPEWVESELLAGPLLQQVTIVGDDRPYCVALVYPHASNVDSKEIENWIRSVNQTLPDYARVARWHKLNKPFTAQEGLLTENGRPKRASIGKKYRSVIDAMYERRTEAHST